MRNLLLLLLALPTFSFALPPFDIEFQYECPEVMFDPHDPNEPLLTNNGSVISGGGDVQVNSRRMDPYHADYSGISSGSNIPLDLKTGGYKRTAVAYLPVPGIVKCHYQSSMNFDAFDVYHLLNNGQGGVVSAVVVPFIVIKFAIG